MRKSKVPFGVARMQSENIMKYSMEARKYSIIFNDIKKTAK